MASQGPFFPGTTASLANAGTSENAEAWVNPGNIVSDNGTEATITAATYDSPDISQLLVASNFGFSIPSDATIDGIVVEIDRRNSAGAASDNRVQLARGTTFAGLVGTNKADTALDWPTTTAVATYGTGTTDLWGTTWTPAQINASSFAVFLSVQADAANTDIQVDYIRVTVHYTPNPNVTITPSPVTIQLVVPVPRINVDTAYQDLVESYLPVMYWPLGEGGGTTAYDEIGAHDGAWQGTPTLGDTGIGDGGAAATFSSDDFVSIADHADLDFTSPFSIMAWVKSDGSLNFVDNAIWGKGTGGVPYLWVTGTGQSPAGRIALAKSDTADIVQTGALITDTAWHCIIAVYSHNTIGKIYVDGVDEGGTPTYNAFSTNSIAAAIGSKTGASGENTWGGSIAHVAIFDYALNATEAADLSTIPSAGDVTLTPSPVTLPLVASAPSLQVGRVMTPSPVTLPLAIPTPTVAAGRIVAPDPVALPLTVTAPTVAVGARVAPDPVALPLAVTSPTLQVGRILMPDPVATLLVVPAPSIAVGRILAPDPVAIVLVVPAPTINAGAGGSDVTLTPDPVATLLVVPAPTVGAGVLLMPSSVALPLVVTSPTVLIGKLLAPDPVALPLVVTSPTIQVGRVVTPSPIAAPLVVPTPTIVVGARITPSPVALPLLIPVPTINALGVLPPGFLDELLELAIAGDLVTVEDLNGSSAGVAIVVTIAGVEVDAGGVLELDVEG